MITCVSCNFENLPSASFCVNCGSALTPRPAPDAQTLLAREAELRFVTILFADLSGFTALTATHPPEDVREQINAVFDRLVPIVEEHGGIVDQFVGDSLMALYGAPIAHEDDPVQACRTALAMLDAIAAVNAERQLDLGLHIGINSGPVLAGGVGSHARRQYSVVGDAVNMASRLQDAAERGEIFVGEETMQLTHEQFEYESRGTMLFKGKPEPQPVWQLGRAKAQAPSHRPLQTRAPMLGRDRELALLRRLARELPESEQGLRVISILGDAGLGKSRLVQEWYVRDALRASRVQYHRVFCAPDNAARAYCLLDQLTTVLTAPTGSDAIPHPLLTALVGAPLAESGTAAGSGTVPERSSLQAQYAQELSDLMAYGARDGALVLIVEDLHWADAPSVEVLARLLGHETPARLLFCFTSRPEREAPGWKLLENTEDLPGVSAMRLHLTPLGEHDAQALLANLLPGDLPSALAPLLLTHAEGNPLFVEELVSMLVERGDLQNVNGEWTLTRELYALDVPPTLQGVLMARVDQLPPNERRVLQIASVLGREFPLHVLERVVAELK